MADVKTGVVSVSYNGQEKHGKFLDNALRNMVYNINFEDNCFQFMGISAQLLKQLIDK